MGPHARQGSESSLEPRTSIARSTGTRNKQNHLRIPAVRQHGAGQGHDRDRNPIATAGQRRQDNQQQYSLKTDHGVTLDWKPGATIASQQFRGSESHQEESASVHRQAGQGPGGQKPASGPSLLPRHHLQSHSDQVRRHDHPVMAGDVFHDIIARFALLSGLFRTNGSRNGLNRPGSPMPILTHGHPISEMV